MRTVNEIADQYVTDASSLDPVTATMTGITGYDDLMPDLSPAGLATMAEVDKRALAELRQVSPASVADKVARQAMIERLTVNDEQYESGAVESDLNVVGSWIQIIRQVFDLMPIEGEEAQRNLATRLAKVPDAYAGLKQTFRKAAGKGDVAARRQVAACAKQCADWSAPETGFYPELARRAGAAGAPAALRAELDRAAELARLATADLGRFLETELLPLAPERDSVGRERWALESRYFLGAIIDPDEAYEWAWAEVIKIDEEMRQISAKICGSESVADAVAALDADPARQIIGRDALKAWMQGIADATITELDGTHFDIPEPARRIDCMIAPTDDGGIYYTPPSEDWSRPGQMWWAPGAGVNNFSTWKELTTIYHEGVPGHHLQMAQTLCSRETLNRYQRSMCWVSGHGEGWALYAERLMEELGYLSDPGNKLGLLDSQMLRAVRVVVDLGLHAQIPVPSDSPWHPGEEWNAALVWEFLRSRVQTDDELLRFELDRYLGWPGQASSYKLGERIWLSAREDARRRQGASFNLKQFHSQALALGSLGLDPLREALARF